MAKGSNTSPVIAKARGMPENSDRVLYDYWTVNGLLSKSNNTYTIAPPVATFLDLDSPAYLGGVAGFMNGSIKPFFDCFTQAIRSRSCESAGSV